MARRRAASPPTVDPSPDELGVRRGTGVPDAPEVSIIVLITTSTDRLLRCLTSIAAAGGDGPSAEILVLANGTSPAELSSIATREDIVLIRSTVNHGFGGGCNWAARFARGARLVFVNDDALATTGWLQALDRALDDDPKIGVAGSRVLLRDGRLQEAGNVIWRDGSTSHVGRTLPGDEPSLRARRDCDYVSFCSAMVRREAWDQAGGFDERYFPAYYEDADLCLALGALGWRVVCEPASVVIHAEGASTPVHLRHFLSRRSQERFVAKWGNALTRFPERPTRTTVGAVMAEAMRHPAPRGVTAAPQDVEADRDGSAANGTTEVAAADVLQLELRHSMQDVMLKDEYIAALTGELDGFGAITLARKRYVAMRRNLGRQARRRRGLRRLAQWVMAGTGRRS
jgi:GT2 family glycosyltransferase